MNVGIIGVGVVGGALSFYLKKNTKHKVFLLDRAKGHLDNLFNCEAVFVCVPTPTRKNGAQGLEEINKAMNEIPKSAVTFIRSTVLPGTCDMLSLSNGRKVFAAPEFLTERRASKDMDTIPVLCAINGEFYSIEKSFVQNIFPGKKIHFSTNKEAELAKYLHNSIAFTKIWLCNALYRLSKIHRIKYENARDASLISGLVNKEHTDVPGPDGKLGIGGKCLPKDFFALATMLEKMGIGDGKIMKQISYLNSRLRGESFLT